MKRGKLVYCRHQLKFHSQDPESEFSPELSPNKLARQNPRPNADLLNDPAYAFDSTNTNESSREEKFFCETSIHSKIWTSKIKKHIGSVMRILHEALIFFCPA